MTSYSVAVAGGVALLAVVVWLRTPTTPEYRADNFSAGPSALPDAVLLDAQANFLNWHGTGMNMMEMSHRDVQGPVQTLIADAANTMRQLLNIPPNYKVLYMHGGAHAQFSAVPLNIMGRDGKKSIKADYVVTGYWSQRAMDEASSLPGVSVRSIDAGPSLANKWNVDPEASYVFVCASETMDGLEFLADPSYDEVPAHIPIVADFTSTLLSRPVNISRYGIIFASSGKNLGPSGVCVVIIREDLIADVKGIPSVLSYFLTAGSKPIPSIYNTPSTYIMYMHGLTVSHLLASGGISVARAIRRAAMVYAAVDASEGFYVNNVAPRARSRMNVPMRILDGRRDLEERFVKEAAAVGLLQLFGHPVKGGLRVTLYNGVKDESIARVVIFMKDFAMKNKQ